MSRSWAAGSVTGWRPLRERVLMRDRYRCQVRGRRCTGVATTVDHVLGVEVTGILCSPELLRAACGPCNYGTRPAGADPVPVPVTRW